jgi:hypothetical protein
MVGYRSLARSAALLVVAVVRSGEASTSSLGLHLQMFFSQLVSYVHKV